MAGNQEKPTFNLWYEDWIGVEQKDGKVIRASIEKVLTSSDKFISLYDPSPLVIVGIHRLLVAILQASLQPKSNSDLENIWTSDCFPSEKITEFGAKFANRFDLFSETLPFMQSVDLSLIPSKGYTRKTIAYLLPEIPAGTAVTHFSHCADDDHIFCPACAAAGIVTLPAFATSGGAGIKPSINGVPPLYIIPGGETLKKILSASLLQPVFQPSKIPLSNDLAWWNRDPIINRSSEVYQVGYLHSLTFAARRLRLHPQLVNTSCTRCGSQTQWGVSTMVFEMGEWRNNDAAPWFDPFAAYRLPDNDDKKPYPIRPSEGKDTWREFSGLFLHRTEITNKKKTIRPRVLDQIADLFSDEPDNKDTDQRKLTFRCIGMRTDMKAKVFEWIDANFEIPIHLLKDQVLAGQEFDRAIQFADDCGGILTNVFNRTFNERSKNSSRFSHDRTSLHDTYWKMLAAPFRQFILKIDVANPTQYQKDWAENVVKIARNVFKETMERMPDDASNLRRRVEAEQLCTTFLTFRFKKEEFNE